MCLLVNPLVTLHFSCSPLQVPDGQQGGGTRPRKVASTRMWLRTRRNKAREERVNLLVTLEESGGEGSRSCQEGSTSIFLAGSTKPSPTSKAWRVSPLGYSTCHNTQKKRWKKGRAGKTEATSSSTSTTTRYQSKPPPPPGVTPSDQVYKREMHKSASQIAWQGDDIDKRKDLATTKSRLGTWLGKPSRNGIASGWWSSGTCKSTKSTLK